MQKFGFAIICLGLTALAPCGAKAYVQTEETVVLEISLFPPPTEERKYKCHLCPYAAKCRANLNQHLTVHSVKLVSTDTEDLVSAVTSEGSDGKKHAYYYRSVEDRACWVWVCGFLWTPPFCQGHDVTSAFLHHLLNCPFSIPSALVNAAMAQLLSRLG